MTEKFIPLAPEGNKKFSPLVDQIKKEVLMTYYRVTYRDGSYEDFTVDTSAEAFKKAKTPEKIHSIKLCSGGLAK